MMRIYTFLFMFLFFGFVSYSQSLKVKGGTIINANGQEVILKGMGLGGWMLQEPYMMQLGGIAGNQTEIKGKIEALVGKENTEKFYNYWIANHCTKADVDSLASWGFNAIRLPMHFNLYTLPVDQEPVAGKNTWIEKGFQLTDSLLSWCKANKIYLILDLHATPGGQGNDNAISDRDKTKPSLWQSEANRKKTIALWEKFAARYVNEDWIGGYDLINEPNWGFQNANDKNGCSEKLNKPLVAMYKQLTTAIRRIDKKHIIIIEGNCWGNNYEGFFPLWDDNTVMSFHKYWNNTHDGSIKKFLDYRKKYNVPIWLGETGENSNTWMTEVIRLCERNKIGWTLWPLKKSGLNNPLQVKLNDGYKQLLEYWKGFGRKPTSEEALSSLMRYAADTKNQNNIFHKDVTDAIMRQVTTEETVAFKPHVIKPNLTVYACDYDLGRAGIAYHDIDSANYWVDDTYHVEWNKGGQYRNDGVDIEPCADRLTNGFNIGYMQDGEWLLYSLSAPEAGTYDVKVRTSSPINGGMVQLFINGTAVSGFVPLPNTGHFQTWKNTLVKNVTLQKGTNMMKVLVVRGGFNLNYMQFVTPETVPTNSIKEDN